MKFSGGSLTRVLLSRAMRVHSAPVSFPKLHFGLPKLGWGPGLSLKAKDVPPKSLPKGDENEPFKGGL